MHCVGGDVVCRGHQARRMDQNVMINNASAPAPMAPPMAPPQQPQMVGQQPVMIQQQPLMMQQLPPPPMYQKPAQ